MKIAWMTLLAALCAAPARALPEPAAGTERWVVTFQPNVKRDGREQALASAQLTPVAHIASDGNSANEFSAAVVDLPAGQELDAAAIPGAVTAERDFVQKWIEGGPASFQQTPFGIPDGALRFPVHEVGSADRGDGPIASAARPELTWGVSRVRAPAAWDLSATGSGVRVAVIDTGVDFNHPDLVGKVDGGYSALTRTERPSDYLDDNGHGTHVAGTVAATRDNRGVVGVAPNARIYAVKVLSASGSGSMSGVVDGIVWAARNGMQVVNMSLGGPQGSETLRNALRYAVGTGVVVVVAAGNSGPPPQGGTSSVGYPGAYPEAITVAASDDADQVASFSSTGPEVDFIAPGVSVVSTRMGGGFTSYNGTSMATPHVAGLAALAVQQGWTGTFGPDGVLAQLRRAARPLPGLSPAQQGAGMIDAGLLAR